MKFINLFMLFVVAGFVLFGCLGGTPPKEVTTSGPSVPSAPPVPTGASDNSANLCSPSFLVSNLNSGTLGKSSSLLVTATCAAGVPVTLSINGKSVDSKSADTNATATLTFSFYPKSEGNSTVSVATDSQTLLSKVWMVSPLGSSVTTGVETDAISFKEWRAVKFTLDNSIMVGMVKAYMKRGSSSIQPGSLLIAEIRSDSGGTPGAVISSVSRPLNVTTLTDNWIVFDFSEINQKLSLQPGSYWTTFRVEQTVDPGLISDVVYLRYSPVDKQAAGNGYTRQMVLSVSGSGAASETSWAPLSYDRIYAVTIGGVQN
ncbi:hypothetical protein HZC07_01025 [Candidatus Micrarchaeota archaeon]|nr:hypothetical protein [Candidatus Micrarchaeota archaeon]